MRVSSRWVIKGAKAYQRCSLTLKQCHMALDILPQWWCVWPGTKWLLCFLKTFAFLHSWSCKKHTKWWGGTSSLSWWKAKGWDWPFWHQLGFGNTMHGGNSFWPFPLQLWAMLTSQRLKSKHLSFYTKTQTCPKPLLLYHSHTHKYTQTEQFCLYICKQTGPVWHHSTTAGYGSKKRQQITVDYINTKAWLSPQYQHHFPLTGIEQQLHYDLYHLGNAPVQTHLSWDWMKSRYVTIFHPCKTWNENHDFVKH